MILPGAAAGTAVPERQVVFIRHGDVEGAGGRCIGQTDLKLSSRGRLAIRKLAAARSTSWLASAPGTPRLVASDLRRTMDSAMLVGQMLDVPAEPDRRLREMHFGEWDGRTWIDIQEKDDARFRAWADQWLTVPTPNGEGVPDLARRAETWIASEVRPRRHDTRTLLVISHSGFIRAAVCQLLGYPLARMFELPVSHACATILRVTTAHATLVTADARRPV